MCGRRRDETRRMIVCDDCKDVFDLDCLEPALDDLPRTSWFCLNCSDRQRNNNRSISPEDDDMNSDDDDSQTSSSTSDYMSDSTVETRRRPKYVSDYGVNQDRFI